MVHISKARDKAVIISLPRDTLVTIPQHTDSKGKIVAPFKAKLNAAYNYGDAPLLIQVIESMTNLRIDHYIEINFAGFAHIVDSLGGIQVCAKRNINSASGNTLLIFGYSLRMKRLLKNYPARGDREKPTLIPRTSRSAPSS